MSVALSGDGTMTIDDPELLAKISALCEITGETPSEAVINAVVEALASRKERE